MPELSSTFHTDKFSYKSWSNWLDGSDRKYLDDDYSHIHFLSLCRWWCVHESKGNLEVTQLTIGSSEVWWTFEIEEVEHGRGLTGLTGDQVIAGCLSQEAEEGVVRKVRREGGGRGRGSDTVSGSCPNIISTALSTQHNLSTTNMSF